MIFYKLKSKISNLINKSTISKVPSRTYLNLQQENSESQQKNYFLIDWSSKISVKKDGKLCLNSEPFFYSNIVLVLILSAY